MVQSGLPVVSMEMPLGSPNWPWETKLSSWCRSLSPQLPIHIERKSPPLRVHQSQAEERKEKGSKSRWPRGRSSEGHRSHPKSRVKHLLFRGAQGSEGETVLSFSQLHFLDVRLLFHLQFSASPPHHRVCLTAKFSFTENTSSIEAGVLPTPVRVNLHCIPQDPISKFTFPDNRTIILA